MNSSGWLLLLLLPPPRAEEGSGQHGADAAAAAATSFPSSSSRLAQGARLLALGAPAFLSSVPKEERLAGRRKLPQPSSSSSGIAPLQNHKQREQAKAGESAGEAIQFKPAGGMPDITQIMHTRNTLQPGLDARKLARTGANHGTRKPCRKREGRRHEDKNLSLAFQTHFSVASIRNGGKTKTNQHNPLAWM